MKTAAQSIKLMLLKPLLGLHLQPTIPPLASFGAMCLSLVSLSPHTNTIGFFALPSLA